MKLRTLCPAFLVAVALGLPLPVSAQDGMPPAGGQQTPQQNQGRPMAEIMQDLQKVQMELGQTMSSPTVLSDPETRDAAAEKAAPVLKRLVGLLAEAAAAAPDPMMAQQLRTGRYQVQAMLVGFGDEEAQKALEGEDSADAKSALALGSFIAGDSQEQKLEAVKQLDAVAEANPESPAVGQTAISILSLAETNEEIAGATKKIINEKLRGPMADQLKMMVTQLEQQQQAAKEFEAKFMDKPLVVEGQTLKGESFSTESLKGKVVMVDFWATWCGPCIAALPKVKEDYKKYNGEGFEIVAVSLDRSVEPLKQFLEQNPEMTWTQIFTENNPQASAEIANKLGIQAIPTVFLLDKNGVVRAMAVGGGEQMDKLHEKIPELLKEEAKTAADTQQ